MLGNFIGRNYVGNGSINVGGGRGIFKWFLEKLVIKM
jgi:hypothetical protein